MRFLSCQLTAVRHFQVSPRHCAMVMWLTPSISHPHTGARRSVERTGEEIKSELRVLNCLYRRSCFSVFDHLTMLVQALANVMYLGLNCRVLMGPGCFPSSTATFIPLSVLQTWTLPSSEPTQWKNKKTKHSQSRDLTGGTHTYKADVF